MKCRIADIDNVHVVLLIILGLSNLLPGAKSKPSFSKKPPSKQYVIQGTDALLEWNYNNDSLQLDFGKWGKKNAELPFYITEKSGKFKYSDRTKYDLLMPATLQLKNVSTSSSGTYFCELNFDHPTDFNPTVLYHEADVQIVKSAPNFTSTLPEKQIGREGSKEIKLVVVVKGDQTPQITWYRNNGLADTALFVVSTSIVGKSVQNETIVQSNLTIKSPNRTSSSVFLAKAAYGTYSPVSNTSTVIDVWYGPENTIFTSSKTGLAIGKNDIVTIQCTANSNPAPKFTIYRNQTIVVNNSANGIYVINKFSSSSAGNYSCLVQNEISSKLIVGIWFTFNESKTIIFSTAKTTTSRSTTAAQPSPASRKLSDASSMPWWLWFTIALVAVVLSCIFVAVFIFLKRKRQRGGKTKRFSRHGDYLDNYIHNTPYSFGHENQVEKSPERNSLASFVEREIAPEAELDHQLAMDNLGMKFESEHDLIEHYKLGPEKKGDHDDDVKDHDPFEDDDSNLDSTPRQSFGDEHGIHYETEDAIKMNSESEQEEPMETEPYIDLENEIIQYDI